MSLLDKLERRFGFLGIPGLTRILVGFAALVFGLAWFLPGFTSILTLDPSKIRHGEVWRLDATTRAILGLPPRSSGHARI